jgi:hypothetical protein
MYHELKHGWRISLSLMVLLYRSLVAASEWAVAVVAATRINYQFKLAANKHIPNRQELSHSWRSTLAMNASPIMAVDKVRSSAGARTI